MSRRIAGAALVALWVSITPGEARAPRASPGSTGWDLFAAERLLSPLRTRGDDALLAEPPSISPARPLTAIPEPGTALLAALGLTALARLRVKKRAVKKGAGFVRQLLRAQKLTNEPGPFLDGPFLAG